ncbi:hypothetical protein [uncultured Aquimarina sp.]|uniref:hypothetical protein n=1 Tax=uncultured Aquimarina sp. TaxID=575652 RepID=UPI002631B25D|nr:hypothetical protein [uncultured Aquimarina sp.]
MKKLFTTLLLIITTTLFSQKYTLDADLIDQFTDDDRVDIIVSASIDSDGFNVIEVSCECIPEEKSFRLRPLSFPNFKIKIIEKIKEIVTSMKDGYGSALTVKSSQDQNIIDNRIAQIFARIVTYYNTEEERPQVATIFLRNSKVPLYHKPSKFSSNLAPIDSINIDAVEMSFYGGFIEKIQVKADFDEKKIAFNNLYSIGISSDANIRELGRYRLYSDGWYTFRIAKKQNKNKEKRTLEYDSRSNKDSIVKKDLIIKLDEVIRYVKKVDINANDISPVPQVVYLDDNQDKSKLYREESSKLFEAVAFTDLIGLFDEENPNGLVQIEVNKRFNLNTKRSGTKNWYNWLFPISKAFDGIGFFQNLDGFFQYSKIEENNKFLSLETVNTKDDSGIITGTENIYTPISLMQYRSYAFGGILNISTLENQNAKFNMYINAGLLFGRTGILDTNAEETFVNNLEVPIEVTGHILPEKRVSFSFTDRLSWFDNLNEDINIKSVKNGSAVSYSRWLNSFNIDLNVNVSSTGKLFLRYKLIHELDNISNNFSQLQFGYSFYILKNNGVRKKQ